MVKAGEKTITVTSTQRTPNDQARIMFSNLESKGVANQKRLYGPVGDKVIDTYAKGKTIQKAVGAFGGTITNNQIKQTMENTINDLGPTNVSNHIANPEVLNVIDIGPSSVTNDKAFHDALNSNPGVNTLYSPYNSTDPAFHIEISQ